ncbi:hypothetical protein AAW14_28235 [Streptomyces hygroscopicus]|uniref:hypothetical protein n=1 Tax=Streptomyces hygroscopicus TaxID=1912 RepID=UPI002240769B|nr:hypothetical protein [Streptomyces hygroscopicus]MCW7945778.1 hypothetical protein [Streptomyces hygroscopicus]
MSKSKRYAVVMAAAAIAGLVGASPAVAQGRQGPPGPCVEGHRTFFLQKAGPAVSPALGGGYTAGNVGVDFHACADQAPEAWTANITNQDTSFWGGMDQYQIEGVLNHQFTGPNSSSFQLRLIVNQCAPIVHWIFNKACAQADEIDVPITFAANEVYKWVNDYIDDPSPEQAADWYQDEQTGASPPYFTEYNTP